MFLNGLRRTLRPMHKQWDTAFATTADEALSLLAVRDFDVLATDSADEPGKDGADLLLEVREPLSAASPGLCCPVRTERKDGLRAPWQVRIASWPSRASVEMCLKERRRGACASCGSNSRAKRC